MNERQPALNLPPVVAWLAGLLVAVHLARFLLDPTREQIMVLAFGFIPARYAGYAGMLPGGDGALWWSPVTYAFLHADVTHLGVNLLWMAAFGSVVARRFGAWRFLILSVLSALGGVALHYVLRPSDPAVVIGASAAISGQTAAAARFVFARGGVLGLTHGSGREDAPATSLVGLLKEPRALFFVLTWFGINLVFGAQENFVPGIEGAIAWQAHIGGFLVGLFAYSALDPHSAPRAKTS